MLIVPDKPAYSSGLSEDCKPENRGLIINAYSPA